MTPPVKVLRAGDWPPGRVTVRWAADGRRRVPEVEAAIEAAWAAAIARPGVVLFDGPMCRTDAWHATDDELSLVLSPGSYKPFVGTNMAHPEFADVYGPDVMANPVGVSPALLTADGYLMLGRRSPRLAYYPGRVHPFAGAMEPADADPFAAARRELAEELAMTDAEVVDLRCTGVAEDPGLRQPELIFAATTTRPRTLVEAHLDRAEHAGTWAVRAEPDALADAIVSGVGTLTPVGLASLLLWGRRAFGDGWMASAVATFAGSA